MIACDHLVSEVGAAVRVNKRDHMADFRTIRPIFKCIHQLILRN